MQPTKRTKKRRRPLPTCRCAPTKKLHLPGRGINTGGDDGARKSIFQETNEAQHTVHSHSTTSTPLLGTTAQLCSSFFHTTNICLHPAACIRTPTTVLVVRVTNLNPNANSPVPPFVARYTSCYRGYSNSIHAEQFLMQDQTLTSLLSTSSNIIDIYITQQPCHFSTGRFATRKISGKTSCTNLLLSWFQAINANTTNSSILNIWTANLFRAHKIESTAAKLSTKEATVYRQRATNAKNGLELLMNKEKNIHIRMIDRDGWDFLFSLTDEKVKGDGENEMERNGVIGRRMEETNELDLFLVGLDGNSVADDNKEEEEERCEPTKSTHENLDEC